MVMKSRRMHKKNYGTRKHALGNKCCDATMHGIQHWYEHEFEHLGWMILAKSRGHMDKVRVYKSSLMRLKMAIEKKIHRVEEHDRKEDLQILLHNVNILIHHVHSHL